jgi:hypothetical protein
MNGAIYQVKAVILITAGVILANIMKYRLSMYISLLGRLGVKITGITYLCSMVSKLFVILLMCTLYPNYSGRTCSTISHQYPKFLYLV